MTLLSMLCFLSDISVLGILVGHCKGRDKGLGGKSCDDYQPAPVYCCFQQFAAILEAENALLQEQWSSEAAYERYSVVPKSTVYLIISLVLCCQQKEITNAYLTPKITHLQK